MMLAGLSPNTFRFTVILGLLAAIPSLSIDISAPTLLSVRADLAAPAGAVGLTITVFMLGFAAGQFGSGPLSDRYGRRPVLLIGLSAYTLAAAGCALAGSIEALICWRLVQGIAAGACAVLAFAMIRDLFEGDEARRKRSYVTVVFGLAPMLAPSLGAWVLDSAGWRPVYVILAAGGLTLLLAALLCVAESRSKRLSLPVPIGSAYLHVLGDRRFVLVALVNALSFGGMFAYIAGSPLVLMGSIGVSAREYGLIFAATAASLTAGAWASARSVGLGLTPERLLWLSLGVALASAVGICALLALNQVSLAPLVVLLMINLFCRGLVAPNAQHMALDPVVEHAGTAAAAVGVMQILAGTASSGLVAFLVPKLGPLGMAVVMALLALGSIALWTWSRIRPTQEAKRDMPDPGLPPSVARQSATMSEPIPEAVL